MALLVIATQEVDIACAKMEYNAKKDTIHLQHVPLVNLVIVIIPIVWVKISAQHLVIVVFWNMLMKMEIASVCFLIVENILYFSLIMLNFIIVFLISMPKQLSQWNCNRICQYWH